MIVFVLVLDPGEGAENVDYYFVIIHRSFVQYKYY